MRPEDLPADDTSSCGSAWPPAWRLPGGPRTGTSPAEASGDLGEIDSAVAAICAIDHFDWLAVITALAEGGPGTSASAADLAAYVRDYDPDGTASRVRRTARKATRTS